MDASESLRGAISRIVGSLWRETGRDTELGRKQESKEGGFLGESLRGTNK